jgi:ERCC4-related helicase
MRQAKHGINPLFGYIRKCQKSKHNKSKSKSKISLFTIPISEHANKNKNKNKTTQASSILPIMHAHTYYTENSLPFDTKRS